MMRILYGLPQNRRHGSNNESLEGGKMNPEQKIKIDTVVNKWSNTALKKLKEFWKEKFNKNEFFLYRREMPFGDIWTYKIRYNKKWITTLQINPDTLEVIDEKNTSNN